MIPPEGGAEPGIPFSPDEMRRLEEMAREITPGLTDTAIAAITGLHAKWYFGWQAAGIPEDRAAEWAGIMIGSQFRQAS